MFTSVPEDLAVLLPSSLLKVCQDAAYPKGCYLFAVGQRPSYMYFVTQGDVVLERPGMHGSMVVLQKTRHGFLGEASLRSDHYHCHGRVMSPTKLVQIPIQAMQSAIDTDSAFSGRWINMLNSEVKRLRLQCERLSLPKLRDRLTHLIETEGNEGQYPTATGIKALASELGVTHEALYRCIYSMEKAGLLQRSSDSIVLLHSTKKFEQSA